MITATIVFLIILTVLAIFQVALALGAPLGHFAWGGQHRVLPRKFRIGSLSSIAVYVLFGAIALSKSEIWPAFPALDISAWVMFAYLALGVLMNAVSRSKPERYTMTPVALILAVCAYIIAAA